MTSSPISFHSPLRRLPLSPPDVAYNCGSLGLPSRHPIKQGSAQIALHPKQHAKPPPQLVVSRNLTDHGQVCLFYRCLPMKSNNVSLLGTLTLCEIRRYQRAELLVRKLHSKGLIRKCRARLYSKVTSVGILVVLVKDRRKNDSLSGMVACNCCKQMNNYISSSD